VRARTDWVGAIEKAKLLAAAVVQSTQIGALLLLLGKDVNVFERVAQSVLQQSVIGEVGQWRLLDAASLVRTGRNEKKIDFALGWNNRPTCQSSRCVP
jgi:hypothetical protein